MNALISELGSMLSEMIDLNGSDMDIIRRLAKTSSQTWLEFQLSRCRIVIAFPPCNLETMEHKAKKAQEGSLDLSTIPSLGRYGNSSGSCLHDFVVIGGYAGESIKFSPRASQEEINTTSQPGSS